MKDSVYGLSFTRKIKAELLTVICNLYSFPQTDLEKREPIYLKYEEYVSLYGDIVSLSDSYD